ncbi:sugar kinase [Rubrobacter tropicus]|uniref:Sugar kinase n=1 Tax=Rubrobacter tropicus TaxID=2653851 RepID=A0A6G8QCZ4_9ACTN|nr:sugar kinase [Rubrobacter tropicus]QIN84308.1 sugar kinase [Rubrobacter tropicus]
MRAPRVLVVGDLLYDLLAKAEGEIVFGTDTFVPIRVAAGGSGANAAAWLASSGVETHFVGRVGDDVFGAFLEGEMERAGVASHLARDASLATGKVFVLVDGAGERTMITDRGASEALNPNDLPRTLFTEGHLHLSGYTLSGGSRRRTALEALRLAREAGMTVSVDPSSAPLLRSVGPERFLDWTRGADLLFPNLTEGETLTGEQDPDLILKKLLSLYPAVVLKLGPEGAVYADGTGASLRVPATADRAEDTTGAGDAFSAGFLAAWLDKEQPAGTMRRGAETAARAVGRVGARPEA